MVQNQNVNRLKNMDETVGNTWCETKNRLKNTNRRTILIVTPGSNVHLVPIPNIPTET